MEREVRRDLTEMAERHAVDVFARNLRSLLLQPPIPKQVVLAIDPGFRTGCKVAVLDGHGNLLDQGVIHPHPPQNRRHEAKLFLKDLVGKHQVGVVAIGNGTACRETEELIAEIIAEGTEFHARTPRPPPTPSRRRPTPRPPPQRRATRRGRADAASPSRAAPPSRRRPRPNPPPRPDPAAAEPRPRRSTSETPVEALPPISGGAPEQASETESAPADADDRGRGARITPPPAAARRRSRFPLECPFRSRSRPPTSRRARRRRQAADVAPEAAAEAAETVPVAAERRRRPRG